MGRRKAVHTMLHNIQIDMKYREFMETTPYHKGINRIGLRCRVVGEAPSGTANCREERNAVEGGGQQRRRTREAIVRFRFTEVRVINEEAEIEERRCKVKKEEENQLNQ